MSFADNEEEFVAKASADLHGYFSRRQFNRSTKVVYCSVFNATLISAVGMVGGLLMAVDPYINPHFTKVRCPPDQWSWYLDKPLGPGIVFLLFLVLMLGWTANQIFARSSSEFAEYAMKEMLSGGNMGIAKRYLRWRLKRLHRKERTSLSSRFEPGTFLIDSYRAMERQVFLASGALLVLTPPLLVNDFRSYTLFTESELRSVRQAGFISETFKYTDVASVRVVCHLTRNNDAWLTYEIDLPSGGTIGLFREGAARRKYSNTLIAHQKLVHASVVPTYRTASPGDNLVEGITGECSDKLSRNYAADECEIIRSLLPEAI